MSGRNFKKVVKNDWTFKGWKALLQFMSPIKMGSLCYENFNRNEIKNEEEACPSKCI